MNKGDFITAISERTDVNKATVATVFNGMTEIITETLKAGEKITIAGFGSYESKHKPARKGRNPKTNEELIVPERNVPKFNFGKTIKEALK